MPIHLTAQSPWLVDIDNDGDLDLLMGAPRLFFDNQGDGTFVERNSADFGIGPGGCSMDVADLNEDATWTD